MENNRDYWFTKGGGREGDTRYSLKESELEGRHIDLLAAQIIMDIAVLPEESKNIVVRKILEMNNLI